MIRYIKMKIKKPGVQNDPGKWHGKIVDNEIIDIVELARIIASKCTIQRPDVEAALRAFVIVMRENFLQGNSVKLQYVGTFKPTAKGSGANTAEGWDKSYLKAINIRFRRSKAIRQAMMPHGGELQYEEVVKIDGAGNLALTPAELGMIDVPDEEAIATIEDKAIQAAYKSYKKEQREAEKAKDAMLEALKTKKEREEKKDRKKEKE